MISRATEHYEQLNATNRVVVRVHGLKKSFGGHVVLDNMDFTLKAGEIVLLRGDNGSGKTTLLNILTGNLQPDAGEIVVSANGTTEYFRFPRPWWTNLNPFDHFTPERVAAEGIGRTWQDIRLFRSQSILSNVMVGVPKQAGEHPFEAVFNPFGVESRTKEVAGLCRAAICNVGLTVRENSSADKISLGQSKRVAILRAIQAGAKVLFLDEPLSGLDGSGITEIMGVLRMLASNHQITLVIVEHVFNISCILDIASTVWTLHGGQLDIQDARSIDNSSAGSIVSTELELRNLRHDDFVQNESPLSGGARLIVSGTKRAPRTKTIFSIHNLYVRRGPRSVINGLNLNIHEGEIVLLHAPNGWGKTTLLLAIAGVIPIDSGSIFYNGIEITKMAPWDRIRLGMSLLPYENNSFASLSIAEYKRLVKVHTYAVSSDTSARHIGSLSGGEHRKMVFQGWLNTSKDFGILDEPFVGMDRENIRESLNMLTAKLMTIIIFEPLRMGVEINEYLAIKPLSTPEKSNIQNTIQGVSSICT